MVHCEAYVKQPCKPEGFFFYLGETELSAREISAFTYIVISCQSGRGVKKCASGIRAAFQVNTTALLVRVSSLCSAGAVRLTTKSSLFIFQLVIATQYIG